MKKGLVHFVLGFFVCVILTLILTFILTIYLDNNGTTSMHLGQRWYLIYQFTKAKDGSFHIAQGRGIFIIGLLGGGISVILKMIVERFKQYV